MQKSILALAVGCVLTIILVATGADAWWFTHLSDTGIATFFSLAGVLGFFIPVIAWTSFLAIGTIFKKARIKTASYVIAFAGMFGFMSSTLLKVFTGRLPPPHELVANVLELSHGFQFGIYRGGVFWGWPSSHTATAFAMSVALAVYYRDKKWVGYVAIAYASYIGLGASMSFHWLGDVVMGAILGTICGILVAKKFQKLGARAIK